MKEKGCLAQAAYIKTSLNSFKCTTVVRRAETALPSIWITGSGSEVLRSLTIFVNYRSIYTVTSHAKIDFVKQIVEIGPLETCRRHYSLSQVAKRNEDRRKTCDEVKHR